MMGYKKVTVNVTDVEETETITCRREQAQVGVELTATYNDLDNERPSDPTHVEVVPGRFGDSYDANYSTPRHLHAGTRKAMRFSHRVEASYTKTDGSK